MGETAYAAYYLHNPEQFPSDNEGGSAIDNKGFEREVEVGAEAEAEVEVEGRRPRRKLPRASLKAAENTQQ